MRVGTGPHIEPPTPDKGQETPIGYSALVGKASLLFPPRKPLAGYPDAVAEIS